MPVCGFLSASSWGMRSRCAVACAIVAAVTLATAGPARADWVAAAFLGHAQTLASTITLTQPARNTSLELVDVHYRGESLKSPQYYGVRMMWVSKTRRWLGIEGEYIHAKVFSQTREDVRVRGTLDGVPVDASLF